MAITSAGSGVANTGGGGGGGRYETLGVAPLPAGSAQPAVDLSYVASGDGGIGIVVVRFAADAAEHAAERLGQAERPGQRGGFLEPAQREEVIRGQQAVVAARERQRADAAATSV